MKMVVFAIFLGMQPATPCFVMAFHINRFCFCIISFLAGEMNNLSIMQDYCFKAV
jgi:hypothetical protein